MTDETTNTTEPETSTATSQSDVTAATESGDAATGGSGADAGDGGDGSDAGDGLAAATATTGTGDAATAGSEKGEGGSDDKGSDDPVVPEKYEISLTVKDAEGKDQAVEIDTALLDEATPILKDLGLTNEAANKVAALVPKVQERLLQQQADEFATQRTQWAKDSQADPDIGGKNWKETQSLAARTLDHFAGGPDKNEDGTYKSGFRQLLVDTGLTNHPDMARLLRAVGAGLAEDGTFAQGDGKIAKKDRLEELYPEDVPKAK